MFDSLRHIAANLRPRTAERASIAKEGHREFVGGQWEELGKLQFNFLVGQGLQPSHVLLDVACGSLRAGRFLIPYLNVGNYLGIDKHRDLITAGVSQELPPGLAAEKQPEFVVSECFEFHQFSKTCDFAIAQSLFTHLSREHIVLCCEKLAAFAKQGCRFFATFGESAIRVPQWARSHSIRTFFYTRGQMERFGQQAGWAPHYLGEWGHPGGQKMIEYVRSEQKKAAA